MSLDISPFFVMELLKRANEMEAEGRRIYHLEAGQPDSGAPPAVVAAAARALESDRIGYVDALGVPALRSRIARYMNERYGTAVTADRVAITTGSSGGFLLAFLATLAPGARVAMSAPYYPAQPNILRSLGFEPVFIETGADSNYQLSAALLEPHVDSIDALAIASPSNPTGAMISGAELRGIASLCDERKVTLISDEIYHGICYGERAHSALEFSDGAIVVNSFSKYFSMTGWRLGWLVVPETRVTAIERLSQNLYISSPVLSQLAAVHAFDDLAVLDGHVSRYATNRALLMDALPGLGYPLKAHPDGAFYIYTELPEGAHDPLEYCLELLRDTGVSVTPGNDFDRGERARALRFSYAAATAVIKGALEALARR